MQSTWLLQATETRKKSVDLWAKEAAYRNSQAGNHFLFNFKKYCLSLGCLPICQSGVGVLYLTLCHIIIIEVLGWLE
jgi:hypothetical protein